MTVTMEYRPVEVDAGDGGMPARRAVIRWAWRLFRREWRAQVLVLALLAVAVAATVLGAAVATNAPSSPNAATFGTADHLVSLPGSDPHLAADIAAIGQRFGTVQVIEDQRLATGTSQNVTLRAQDPAGPYGRPRLALTSGRYPTGPGQVAMTSQVASLYNLHVGDVWHEGGTARRVVGLVENPNNLLDEFALVAPGQIGAPTQATVLFDATPDAVGAFTFPAGVTPQTPAPASGGFSPEFVVLISAIFGLVFIGLVATAGFTVLAQRRLRSLGMLSSLGATDRDVRLVMIANGAVVGIVAALCGAVVGLAAWFGYAPRLQTSTAHRIDPMHLPWWLVGVGMLLAVVTAVAAARRPARAVARMPVAAALSGHPAPPRAARRLAVPGAVLLAVGPGLLALSGGWGSQAQTKTYGGLLATLLGLLLVAPACLSVMGPVGRHAPIAVRLALRDLVRYRARSGSSLAAISFAVLTAVFVSILATARYADPLDYFGHNLEANQLIAYAPGANPNLPGPPPGKGGQQGSAQQNAQPQDLGAQSGAIAAALGSHDTVELDTPGDPATTYIGLVKTSTGRGAGGQIYVATPALLAHYGIAADQVDPDADLLTSRAGLDQLTGLNLSRGDPSAPPGPDGCTGDTCIADPRIQTLDQLPVDVSGPNLLITEHALRRLGLGSQQTPAGWLIQTARPLTSAQINTARQLALAAGATIETRSQSPSLNELRNWATAAGILIALGVLAMTVGLIRGEAAGDLRTLTATGASSRVRRVITGATAGGLGLVGAVLGTAVAYLAAISYYRSNLSMTVSHVPVGDLIAIVVGLPIVATLGGWLFAGREPRAIAQKPAD
ncbi:MAG TPA: ABC transporter permease [Rugosimonospora sp.]